MEDYITLSAKTLDDAITEALVQLGVTSDRLDILLLKKEARFPWNRKKAGCDQGPQKTGRKTG